MRHLNITVAMPRLMLMLLLGGSANGQSMDMYAVVSPQSNNDPNTLATLDTGDGTLTLVGGSGLATGMRAMDFDPVSGVLVGTNKFDLPGVVSEVDLATGASTAVAILDNAGTPILVGPVAYSPDGTLFGIAGNNIGVASVLGIIDLQNDLFSSVLTLPAGRIYSGMDFAPDGTLFAVYNTFPGQTLSQIDVSVPAVVSDLVLGPLTVDDIDFAADGFIYHTNFSAAVFRMDPATGQQTNVGFGSDTPAGLASAPGTPPAAGTSFTGEIIQVDIDTGTGQFAGLGVGEVFSGLFRYGADQSQASQIVIEDFEADYQFTGEPYRSTLYSATPPIDSLEVSVNHQDEVLLDEDEAALLSALLGEVVTSETPIDTWAARALSIGAYEEDPDPFDMDDEELLFDGFIFDMVFIGVHVELHDGLGFNPVPPALEDADLTLFTIVEADEDGNILYFALGLVDMVGDMDDDGVADRNDNCQLTANTDQRDSNGDGFGNACDADLDGNCAVNFLDLALMKAVFFSTDEHADLTGDGAVNFFDLAVMKATFFGAPGPSKAICP